MIVWIIGIAGSGKTTLAKLLHKTLKKNPQFCLMEITLENYFLMI